MSNSLKLNVDRLPLRHPCH